MYITLEIKKDWLYLFSEKVELLNLGLMKWKFLRETGQLWLNVTGMIGKPNLNLFSKFIL